MGLEQQHKPVTDIRGETGENAHSKGDVSASLPARIETFFAGSPREIRGGLIAIGNFDGVHRGHQHIFHELVRQARAARVPAIVLTFDPLPIAVLAPSKAPQLITLPEVKGRLIMGLGVDAIVVFQTDAELLNLTAEEFFQKVLVEHFQARGFVEGSNFCFGKARRGNVAVLKSLSEHSGQTLTVVESVAEQIGSEAVVISSSRVREAISKGEMRSVAQMLGRPHQSLGIVETGAGRGRTIGFPTANMGQIATILPPNGVYAGRCHWQGQAHTAAVHIGPNLTFGEADRKVELHLLDFTGDLYGEPLRLDWLERIRGTVKFSSVEQLREQLNADIAAVREAVEK